MPLWQNAKMVLLVVFALIMSQDPPQHDVARNVAAIEKATEWSSGMICGHISWNGADVAIKQILEDLGPEALPVLETLARSRKRVARAAAAYGVWTLFPDADARPRRAKAILTPLIHDQRLVPYAGITVAAFAEGQIKDL